MNINKQQRLSMTYVQWDAMDVAMDRTEGQKEMGWDGKQTVNLLFMHAHVAVPSGRCTRHWFRCVI